MTSNSTWFRLSDDALRFGLHRRPNTHPSSALPSTPYLDATIRNKACFPPLHSAHSKCSAARGTEQARLEGGDNLHFLWCGLAPALRCPPTLCINSHIILTDLLSAASAFSTLDHSFLCGVSQSMRSHHRRYARAEKDTSTPIAHPPSAASCRPRSPKPRSDGWISFPSGLHLKPPPHLFQF